MVKFKYYNSSSTFNSSSLSNDDIAFVEDTKSIYTHGTEFGADTFKITYDANSHSYVDLGLPSGTLWATMNVGAQSATDYGNYYSFGCGAEQYLYQEGIVTDSLTEDEYMSSMQDTAALVWGGDWHTPTALQFEELLANTTHEYTTLNGVTCEKFTATNGNYIYLPAAGGYSSPGTLYLAGVRGFYWTSSPTLSSFNNNVPYIFATSFIFRENNFIGLSDGFTRTDGLSVRPVMDKTYAIKKRLGLDNVNNVKSVSVAAKQRLGIIERKNARENLGIDNISLLVTRQYSSTQSSGESTALSEDGCETRLIKNTHSTDTITIPIATTLSGVTIVNLDDNNDLLEIPAGGYGEISFLRIGTTVYIRSIVSE